MKVNPSDNPIAVGLGVLVAERLSKVLDANLSVSLVNSIKDGGESSREGVGLLDAHRLAEADHEANQQVDRVIDELIGATFQRPLLRPTGPRLPEEASG
jgi:hypothetical protein